MAIQKNELSEIEEEILNMSEKLHNYYSDESLYSIMENTKNKKVFLKCMDNILIPYLINKIRDPQTSQEMIFKLTLHPHSMVQHAIMKRDDVTPAMLKQMIDNSKSEEMMPMRYSIINHKKMNEETLYKLSDYDNNQILSLILLTNIVSERIIKKLQYNNDDEIRIMAKVRDPETDPKYIEKIIKRELRKADRVKGDYINRSYGNIKPFLINDTLEAAIRNPKLPTELVDLYKKFSKPTLVTLVIPHPNVSKELLDFYYTKGDEEVKSAVLKRTKEQHTH